VAVSETGFNWLAVIVSVALLIVLYMVYRIIWHPDFGLMVKRRAFRLHLRVERDQTAYVPFWWSNLQVRRALDRHWNSELRVKKGEPPPDGDGP
jgi:hypothetical protein